MWTGGKQVEIGRWTGRGGHTLVRVTDKWTGRRLDVQVNNALMSVVMDR